MADDHSDLGRRLRQLFFVGGRAGKERPLSISTCTDPDKPA